MTLAPVAATELERVWQAEAARRAQTTRAAAPQPSQPSPLASNPEASSTPAPEYQGVAYSSPTLTQQQSDPVSTPEVAASPLRLAVPPDHDGSFAFPAPDIRQLASLLTAPTRRAA